MMRADWIDSVPMWVLLTALCALSGATMEGGYRFGAWRKSRCPSETEGPVGAMVASILGLFAFMLAFTFGMAAERHEKRRQAVLSEANAIGTTYLRSQLIPERQRNDSIRLLREYVDVRLQGTSKEHHEWAVNRSEEIHRELWALAVKATESNTGMSCAMYIQSLNNLIDIHGARIQAGLANRIPGVIWLVLLLLSLFSMLAVGYQAGITAASRSPAMALLVLAFGIVIFLIGDLNRPQEGFIIVSQKPLISLKESMNAGNR